MWGVEPGLVFWNVWEALLQLGQVDPNYTKKQPTTAAGQPSFSISNIITKGCFILHSNKMLSSSVQYKCYFSVYELLFV